MKDRNKRNLIKYCMICYANKPERTHHCSKCNRCVLNMDHHCPWLNVCIGLKNRKHFILLLFYTLLVCFVILIGAIDITFNILSDVLVRIKNKYIYII